MVIWCFEGKWDAEPFNSDTTVLFETGKGREVCTFPTIARNGYRQSKNSGDGFSDLHVSDLARTITWSNARMITEIRPEIIA